MKIEYYAHEHIMSLIDSFNKQQLDDMIEAYEEMIYETRDTLDRIIEHGPLGDVLMFIMDKDRQIEIFEEKLQRQKEYYQMYRDMRSKISDEESDDK